MSHRTHHRAPFPATSGLVTMTDEEFRRFQRLIEDQAGIYFCPAKKALIAARLAQRLKELRVDSFSDYYKRLTGQQGDHELACMLDRIATNQTHFFREPRQFQFLDQHIFPKWAAQANADSRPKKIKVWSAGCSTGEEAYSIAMTILDHFPSSLGWRIEVLATDLSSRALELARGGVWAATKAKEIPTLYLKRFMLKGSGTQEGKMKVGPEVRSIVKFERHNLNDEVYPGSEPFDLIFCCNVLIYFSPRRRPIVVRRILNRLAPAGYFFVGHAENLSGLASLARRVTSTVYTHADNSPPQFSTVAERSREESANL